MFESWKGTPIIFLFCLIIYSDQGPSSFKDREYLGTIEQLYLNQDYAAVLFESKVQIHLVDNETGEVAEERESKLFPEGNLNFTVKVDDIFQL